MNATTPIPNAGVHFPPPLVYVAGFAVGWLLDRVWPLQLGIGGLTVRALVASLFLLAWLGMMAWALATFRTARTSLVPNRPSSALATNGPYRVTRNPMYASLVMAYDVAELIEVVEAHDHHQGLRQFGVLGAGRVSRRFAQT